MESLEGLLDQVDGPCHRQCFPDLLFTDVDHSLIIWGRGGERQTTRLGSGPRALA